MPDHTEPSGGASGMLQIALDEPLLAELGALARERELTPEALAARWVRERLAHERERALGRARLQRGDGNA